MTPESTVPTASQIRAQVAAIRQKSPHARIIGIAAAAGSDIGPTLVVDGETFAVVRTDSVLGVRERLATLGADPAVILTSLDERDLGVDVCGRLAKGHLFPIEPWQLVKLQFKARYVDPRLVEQYSWVSRRLLELAPPEGYPPTPSGFLEAETAWSVLFGRLLGLLDGRRDPETLLEWSLDPEATNRLTDLPPDERGDLIRAVGDTAGTLSKRIFESIASSHGVRALSIGLVARVLYDRDAAPDVETSKATVRLEPYVGNSPLDPGQATGWAEAAETVLQRTLLRDGIASVLPVLEEADRFLAEILQLPGKAHRSRVLISGFEQRMAQVGGELSGAIAARESTVPQGLRDAVQQAREHLLGHHDPRRKARADRVQMALRLTNWLAGRRREAVPMRSFSEAATAYGAEGGFVDWARAQIWDGDSESTLGRAYGDLDQAVLREREVDNKRFGELLAGWLASGSYDESIIPVENVIDQVVAPLAKDVPVLLLVLDGMSMAIFRELQWKLPEGQWLQLVPEGREQLQPAIAALPSVTQVSRASLLSGTLHTGVAKDEAGAFAANATLDSVSEQAKAPVLFHKADLTSPGSVGLPMRVADALIDSKQRVVGLVINAIDDHLAKGDQVRLSWTVQAIRPLDAVLSAAQDGGRIVVMVSDHGHVVEHHSEMLPGGSEERWRDPGTDPPSPRAQEVLLKGQRVLLGSGNQIVAPWSECVRYGPKKNGYHGGASPQEVVIPLGVFSAGGMVPPGWCEAGSRRPEWWYIETAPGDRLPPKQIPFHPVKPVGRAKPPTGQGDLKLTPVRPAKTKQRSTAGPAGTDWIEQLVDSETLKLQRKLAARTPISDDRVRAVLGALSERGGKLTRSALASRLGMPMVRVGGMVSALQRILNVDGYPVLAVDEASDTITLNLEILMTQFDLETES